jgi:hypothetical protein
MSLTPAEIDAIAVRLAAHLNSRFDDLDAGTAGIAKAQAAHGRALGRMNKALAKEPDRVGVAVTDFKVGFIQGLAKLPSKIAAYASANPGMTMTAITGWGIALGGFLVDLSTGSPVSAALGRAILAGFSPATATGTGGAP